MTYGQETKLITNPREIAASKKRLEVLDLFLTDDYDDSTYTI